MHLAIAGVAPPPFALDILCVPPKQDLDAENLTHFNLEPPEIGAPTQSKTMCVFFNLPFSSSRPAIPLRSQPEAAFGMAT